MGSAKSVRDHTYGLKQNVAVDGILVSTCSEGCSHIFVIVQREATSCFDIWTKFSPPPLALCAIHAAERAWSHSTADWKMKILLYNPNNGVTRNFMPHLWMFLLQALTLGTG